MKTLRTLLRESPLFVPADKIRTLVRESLLFLPARNIRAASWEFIHKLGLGRIPPPPSYKQLIVKRFAKRYALRTLVETGTYRGRMIAATARHFDHIYSVEVDDALFDTASSLFTNQRHIQILHGDSATQMPRILEQLDGPALFWLDAHFSGEGTGGEGTVPLRNELIGILSADERGHVILMDDARAFDGSDGYPTLEQLRDLVKDMRPDLRFGVEADIARIEPAT